MNRIVVWQSCSFVHVREPCDILYHSMGNMLPASPKSYTFRSRVQYWYMLYLSLHCELYRLKVLTALQHVRTSSSFCTHAVPHQPSATSLYHSTFVPTSVVIINPPLSWQYIPQALHVAPNCNCRHVTIYRIYFICFVTFIKQLFHLQLQYKQTLQRLPQQKSTTGTRVLPLPIR